MFLVLPENWDAVQIFLAVQTQWDFHPMTGVRCGLKYQSVWSAIDRFPRTEYAPSDWELFEQVRLMEAVTLSPDILTSFNARCSGG